jgi:hypothetical protein
VLARATAPVAGQVEVVRGHLGAARRAVLHGVVVEHGDDELARRSKILAQTQISFSLISSQGLWQTDGGQGLKTGWRATGST